MGDRFRFEQAVAAIDAANAEDPTTIEFRGQTRPAGLLHAEMMTAWVRRLDPNASEPQLLAARAHHLRQAEEVGQILVATGFDGATVERVGSIIHKEGLGVDPAVQVHEDALCLVFLQTQLDPLTERLGDDQTVDVVRRTLARMSEEGRATALGLDLSDHGRSLVESAITDG